VVTVLVAGAAEVTFKDAGGEGAGGGFGQRAAGEVDGAAEVVGGYSADDDGGG
jgi:hypothetical protein